MKIAIIGCGVIGLTTGILLLREGHEVTIYAERTPESNPSVQSTAAAAIWLPLWTADERETPPGYSELQTQWCIDSWEEFLKLTWEKYGIRWKRNHELFPHEESAPELLKQLMPKFEATFDDKLPEIPGFPLKFRRQVYRWSFDTLVIEMPIYLSQLLQDFRDYGGTLVRKTFETSQDLRDLSERVIFNCTGLGSRKLFLDHALKGIKGQLLLHEPVDIDFSIGAGFFCLIPRSDALILGALLQEVYETEAPTKANEEMLWHNISKVCEMPGTIVSLPSGVLSRGKIKDSIAGIRPYRTKGVRIEVEKLFDKCIIHDYGHGGAGVTLSWGCAKHAVALLQTISI